MALYKNKYRIETTRLKEWDYAQEAYYFVTVCVKNKQSLFGKIHNGGMILNKNGRIVKQTWEGLPGFYKGIQLYEFVVMPDHFHGIIQLKSCRDGALSPSKKPKTGTEPSRDGALSPSQNTTTGREPQSKKTETEQQGKKTGVEPCLYRYSIKNEKTLSSIIGGFKSYTTKEISRITGLNNKIWQPRFYDRIIRDEFEFYFVSEYIKNNPIKEQLENDDAMMVEEMEKHKER